MSCDIIRHPNGDYAARVNDRVVAVAYTRTANGVRAYWTYDIVDGGGPVDRELEDVRDVRRALRRIAKRHA